MLTKKNLIFIGAPGAGQGTFSNILLEKYPLTHISTGDLLRAEIKNDTQLGREAAGLMKAGKLVPDEVVSGMVGNKLSTCDNGFILDGFPRTLNQAALLDQALAKINSKLDAVVYFKVDDEVILQRLTARISCRECGEIYNKIFMPPKVAGKCDKCGGELFQRPDDSLETAKERLAVFYKNTQPLIDHYAKRGLLITISETDLKIAVPMLEKELA